MRERWFGATGRRVPALAVEGEIDTSEALLLDTVDEAAIRSAFDRGTPVVVRASSVDEVKAALARPEVSCVVVPPERTDLVNLDLTEITYG